MKKMSKTIIGFIFGILVAFTIDVAAEAVISSGSVSYGNTTVNTALDELFSAVDINENIGDMTQISGIGNGTITNAIATQNTSIANSIKRSDYYKKLNNNGAGVGSYLNAVNTSRPVLIYDVADPMNYWFGFYGCASNNSYYILTKIASYKLEAIANAYGTISVSGGSGTYNYYNIIPYGIGL